MSLPYSGLEAFSNFEKAHTWLDIRAFSSDSQYLASPLFFTCLFGEQNTYLLANFINHGSACTYCISQQHYAGISSANYSPEKKYCSLFMTQWREAPERTFEHTVPRSAAKRSVPALHSHATAHQMPICNPSSAWGRNQKHDN